MNKAEFIKGLNMAIEGLTAMRDAVEKADGNAVAKTASTPAPAATSKPAIGGAKKAPVTPAKTTPAPKADGQTYTTSELSGMKYNEFKKLASSLGVDCKGTRDEIMARVVALGVVTDAGESSATSAKEDKKPVAGGKSNKPASMGKIGANKSNSPATDEFDAQAEEIAKTTSFEDIVEALSGVGIKATKLNYKKMLAKALREGLLNAEDEEAGAEEAGGDEMTAEDYYADYDIHEVNNPDDTEHMSEARKAACIEKQGAILEAVTSGELTIDEITDYVTSHAEQEELDLLGEDYTEADLVQLYIEVTKHFIDSEGTEHEPGDAYMIGDDAYCCGQPLTYDEATNKFLCSHCGQDYSAE